MRQVTCDPWTDPEEFRRQLEAHLRIFKAHFERGDPRERPKIREVWYKRFREYLLAVFHNKCAYCEVKLVGILKGDVEHFRPKNAVYDRNGNRVMTRDGKPHPGYWWKAYDWGNLLPACKDCNATHQKGNRFPVVGDWYAEKPEEQDEPLLINPLFEDPAQHIRWNVATGTPVGVDEKGQLTIDILGLSRRESLTDLRKREQLYGKDAVMKILTRQCSDDDLRNAETYVLQVKGGEVPFSAYALEVIRATKAEYLDRARNLP